MLPNRNSETETLRRDFGEFCYEFIPFDDRDGTIWFDGRLVPWRDAKIHVLTHALHYASCVFEGERVYSGKVFKLTEHSQRLADSAKLLGFDLPMSVAEIDEATRQVVAANNIKDGYVRPVAWRGAEQMGVAAQQTKIHIAIATWLWPSYFPAELRLKGIRMMFAPNGRARTRDRADESESGRPLHDLHPLQARGRGRGLSRCADARLARPGRRGDRRQRLPRRSTATCIRRRRTASSTASPGAR